ncbi:MAG: hypothetical protein LBI80_05430 [Endomicrobium sp.]|jgi:hypothetical protein|nr:hypothetical protein [Endomicrobium sp.]
MPYFYKNEYMDQEFAEMMEKYNTELKRITSYKDFMKSFRLSDIRDGFIDSEAKLQIIYDMLVVLVDYFQYLELPIEPENPKIKIYYEDEKKSDGGPR